MYLYPSVTETTDTHPILYPCNSCCAQVPSPYIYFDYICTLGPSLSPTTSRTKRPALVRDFRPDAPLFTIPSPHIPSKFQS